MALHANDGGVAQCSDALVFLEILVEGQHHSHEPTPRQAEIERLFWERLDMGDACLQAIKLAQHLQSLYSFLLENEEALQNSLFHFDALVEEAGVDLDGAVTSLLEDIRDGKVVLPE